MSWTTTKFIPGILALLAIASLAACGGSSETTAAAAPANQDRNPGTTRRPRGAFTLAAAVQLFKGAWTGPSLTISRAGHPLNGLEVRDNSGNIPAGTEVTITSSAVNSHTFGARFKKVLTPLIIVQAAAQIRGPIVVRIPKPAGFNDDCDVVSTDPSEGFLVYETVAGTDAKFVDVVLYKVKVAGAISKRGDQGGIVIVDSVTPINQVEIPDGRALVESASGFLPGKNDWPFVNWGSFASPGGDCAGMSITASWIYATQTGPFLRNDTRFNEDTPAQTADDRDSRRLAAKAQSLLGTAGALGLTSWWSGNLITPDTPAKLIKTAKKRFADGVPCLLTLLSSTANGGHAVIAFAAGSNNLLIADPNFPGTIRHLTASADLKTWNPFSAQLNAGTAGSNYDIFYLVDPMKFNDVLEPLYNAAVAGDVGADAFNGVKTYSLEDFCSKKIVVKGTDNFVLENPDLKFFPVSDYQIGVMNESTGSVDNFKFYFKSPGNTTGVAVIKDGKQMVNVEKGVFDPDDNNCDFCSNMVPHRTKKPIDVDIRVPIYFNAGGSGMVWFDSINLKIRMKPMELDPALQGGGS